VSLSSDVAKAKFDNVAPKYTRKIVLAWMSKDLRSLIVNKIVIGGDPATGIFNGKFIAPCMCLPPWYQMFGRGFALKVRRVRRKTMLD
jgi:hypothetical protein